MLQFAFEMPVFFGKETEMLTSLTGLFDGKYNVKVASSAFNSTTMFMPIQYSIDSVAVCGPPGCGICFFVNAGGGVFLIAFVYPGKSTLVRTQLWASTSKYPALASRTFWMDASSTDGFVDEVVWMLSRATKTCPKIKETVDVECIRSLGNDTYALCTAIQNALSNIDKWILVLDNLENPVFFRPLWELLSTLSNSGRVYITTRNSSMCMETCGVYKTIQMNPNVADSMIITVHSFLYSS